MRSLACLVLIGSIASPALARAAPASAQRRGLEAGKAALEKLRHDPRRRRYRDGWEAVARDLDGALKLAPSSALAPEVALWAARARAELYEASRAPADVRAAVLAYRSIDEAFPEAPQGLAALVAAVRLGARAHERTETAAAARRLLSRYPKSPEGRAALALLPPLPKAVPAPAGKPQKPVTVAGSDDEDGDAPTVAASARAAGAAAAPSPERSGDEPAPSQTDVPREVAHVIEEMVQEARGARATPAANAATAPSANAATAPSANAATAPIANAATAPIANAAPSPGAKEAPAQAPPAQQKTSPPASDGHRPAGLDALAGTGVSSSAGTWPAPPRDGAVSPAASAAAPAAGSRPRSASADDDGDAAASAGSAGAGKLAAGEVPPEPEAEANPPQRTLALVKLAKDAVARLTGPEEEPDAAQKARELRATALSGGNSLAAQLGLKVRRVVIDPGHGGKDTGAIGPHGVREKDVALSIARRLAARLRASGFIVSMTRKDDTFVALDERTRIANEARADLFVSIHCNAARKRTLSGIETWTLNVASDRYAARLSAFENADDERTVSDLRLILADLATKANAGDARELAQSVQSALVRGLRSRIGKVTDHGVKQALFYVLLGTHMPSILVETAFLSNPAEEARLRSAKYQEGAAEAIARGVKEFVDGRQRLALAP